ncbi:uncharacterized protein LOC143735533 [Siphateles boraxobius]|uniref:uncharacterized protein LOC143735533 n=1 Tax=Siphateles boraxobius TaxID=180520 RepID=UPI004064608C
MVTGRCFICVFAALINKVCLQETVEAVIGGSVLLPCSSSEHHLTAQDTDVNWRHNGSENVYDIVKGEDLLQLQDPRYKNRAESLPDEYKRGNYSIKLKNLTHTDAGKYICYITHSFELQTVQLIIRESTAGKESKSTEHENSEDGSESLNCNSTRLHFTESTQITECHNHTAVEFIDQNQTQWQIIIIIISGLMIGLLLIVLIGLVKVFVVGNRRSAEESQLNTDLQQTRVIEEHDLQYATMDFSKLRRNIRPSQINSTYAALNLPKS